MDTMEKVATPDVLPRRKKDSKGFLGATKALFGGSPISSKNPVYGFSNFGLESEKCESYSNPDVEDLITNPIYGGIPEVTPEIQGNEYEIFKI